MENRSYAFFLPERSTEKRKNIPILLSVPGIHTPILQDVSISGIADNSDRSTVSGFQGLDAIL
jgi:hypothetical protein